MSDYYLPLETERLLTPERLRRCKNLGLLLDKYPPQTAIDTEKKENKDGKSNWLREFTRDSHIDTRLAEQVYQRWRRAVTAMEAQHFTATTEWRMVVGLGGETVLETDLTLHHLYGIPFIPGSALKGLTRAYVTGEIYPSKRLEDDNAEVQRIFGTQDKAGSVIFFDALPVDGRIEIDLDIMNVHYPKYYGEKRPPTNTENPIPVTFLTVTDTTFLFALAPRRSNKDTEDVARVMGWLQDALQKYGVGGKTSAGYGYFVLSQQQEPDVIPSRSGKEDSAPASYIRPPIPKFIDGQGISGTVVAATDELRRVAPAAKAFLRYREFSLKDVLIIVDAEEAANWTPGNTRNCLFVREDERKGCTVLICQPGLKKNKKKKA
jgi:CRISPR-associated protein Cmr6